MKSRNVHIETSMARCHRISKSAMYSPWGDFFMSSTSFAKNQVLWSVSATALQTKVKAPSFPMCLFTVLLHSQVVSHSSQRLLMDTHLIPS